MSGHEDVHDGVGLRGRPVPHHFDEERPGIRPLRHLRDLYVVVGREDADLSDAVVDVRERDLPGVAGELDEVEAVAAAANLNLLAGAVEGVLNERRRLPVSVLFFSAVPRIVCLRIGPTLTGRRFATQVVAARAG